MGPWGVLRAHLPTCVCHAPGRAPQFWPRVCGSPCLPAAGTSQALTAGLGRCPFGPTQLTDWLLLAETCPEVSGLPAAPAGSFLSGRAQGWHQETSRPILRSHPHSAATHAAEGGLATSSQQCRGWRWALFDTCCRPSAYVGGDVHLTSTHTHCCSALVCGHHVPAPSRAPTQSTTCQRNSQASPEAPVPLGLSLHDLSNGLLEVTSCS